MKKEAIRVSTAIPVAPTTLYFAWIDSAQHSAMTGKNAKLDPSVGSKFSAADGYITGKLVTLDLGRRIIMSWRTSDFPRDAHDSRVEVHFEGLGSGTRVTVLHTEIPEGQGEKYRGTWMDTYFSPMRNHFSKYLPDPRNPPVRRPPPPPMDDEEEEDEEVKDLRARGKNKLAANKLAAKAKLQASKGPSVAKAAPSRPALPTKSVKAAPAPAKAAKVSKAPAKPAPKAAAKPAPKAAKPAAKPAKPTKKPAPKAAKKLAAKPAKPAKKLAAKPGKPAKKPAPKGKPAKKKR